MGKMTGSKMKHGLLSNLEKRLQRIIIKDACYVNRYIKLLIPDHVARLQAGKTTLCAQ